MGEKKKNPQSKAGVEMKSHGSPGWLWDFVRLKLELNIFFFNKPNWCETIENLRRIQSDAERPNHETVSVNYDFVHIVKNVRELFSAVAVFFTLSTVKLICCVSLQVLVFFWLTAGFSYLCWCWSFTAVLTTCTHSGWSYTQTHGPYYCY